MLKKNQALDSRQQMARLVDQEGFSADEALHRSPSKSAKQAQIAPQMFEQPTRMLRGPHVYDGDLCELVPGQEAVVLVSPSGEAMVMQAQGPVTLHVPNGWSLMVGSLPLKEKAQVSHLVEIGGELTEQVSDTVVTRLNHLCQLYAEAGQCRGLATRG